MNSVGTEQNHQLAKLVDMDDPQAVLTEVETIVRLMHPGFNVGFLQRAYGDVLKMFAGQFPGYRACNTEYHDLKHTTDATLAMTRLIHGAVMEGNPISARNVELAVASTLFHDIGYIQSEGDDGTGAKYTKSHIERSADFLTDYFRVAGFPEEDATDGRDMLACTGLTVRIGEIRFRSFEVRMLGMMLGTADLLGQMADRTYLEKLSYLYREFKEAEVPGFNEEIDMYINTLGFYELTKKRFASDLGGVNRFMRTHFRERWGVDADLYASAIERQMDYLRAVLEKYRPDYRNYLRRWQYLKKEESVTKK